jgi:tRNA(Ile)-lysidine synthase
MSKKDSSVLQLKNLSSNNKTSLIYSNFRSQLNTSIKKNTFLVAVSGGPDSLALSALSYTYLLEKKTKVFFVLVDHGIRANSSKEAQDVKNLLREKGINLKILKNKKKINKNIQSHAREIRYKLLLNFCKKNKIKFIMTGHHRDDQIETFLIRLSRGSGIQGLSSMSKVSSLSSSTKLFRPLLDEKKKNLIFLAKYYFGKIFKDPSNANQKYLRTKVRNLIKQFEKSGIKHDRIINSINNLASTRDTLNIYIKKIERNCVIKKNNTININLNFFLLENNEIQLKIFSNCIKIISKNYYPPRAKKVLNLLNRIESNKSLKATLGGCIINRHKKNLVISKEELKKSHKTLIFDKN